MPTTGVDEVDRQTVPPARARATGCRPRRPTTAASLNAARPASSSAPTSAADVAADTSTRARIASRTASGWSSRSSSAAAEPRSASGSPSAAAIAAAAARRSSALTGPPPRGSRRPYAMPFSHRPSPSRRAVASTTVLPGRMNSAPISTTAPLASRWDHTRPPTRSRASSTITSAPPRCSASAAANPASPAPTTATRRIGGDRTRVGASSMPTRHQSDRSLERTRERGGSRTTVLIALAANALIMVAKLAAGLISGSTAMLAEAAHSLADTTNQGFLLASIGLAAKPPDEKQPFGHGRQRFLWTFLAAVLMFVAGAVFAIGYGIYELVHGAEADEQLRARVGDAGDRGPGRGLLVAACGPADARRGGAGRSPLARPRAVQPRSQREDGAVRGQRRADRHRGRRGSASASGRSRARRSGTRRPRC